MRPVRDPAIPPVRSTMYPNSSPYCGKGGGREGVAGGVKALVSDACYAVGAPTSKNMTVTT